MIKLQDFASDCGVTDRQIQRLLKKYESEVVGHFERRGQNGTWLDSEACSILRSKMKIQTVELYDSSKDEEIRELKEKIKILNERIERKDVLYEKLQQRCDEQSDRLLEVGAQMLQIESKNQEQINTAVKAAEDKLTLELQAKHRDEEKTLKEHYNQVLKEKDAELENERNRKLTLKEGLKRMFQK